MGIFSPEGSKTQSADFANLSAASIDGAVVEHLEGFDLIEHMATRNPEAVMRMLHHLESSGVYADVDIETKEADITEKLGLFAILLRSLEIEGSDIPRSSTPRVLGSTIGTEPINTSSTAKGIVSLTFI